MTFWIIIITLILLLFFIIVTVIDGNRFIIKEYEFTTDKVNEDVCFAVVSDLHNKMYGHENQRLLNAIRSINPDVVLMTGDILTGGRYVDDEPAARFVEHVAAEYTVLYENGNHEQRLREKKGLYKAKYDAYMERLSKAGVKPLINESYYLSKYNITIYGTEIAHKFYSKFHKITMKPEYLTKLLGVPNSKSYNIMLAHNPDYFEEYAEWGPDLVLSGHIHGGMVRLPILGGVLSPTYRFFPKYDSGLYQEKKSKMVLSRGLGMHTIPIRFLNPGELIILRIKSTRG